MLLLDTRLGTISHFNGCLNCVILANVFSISQKKGVYLGSPGDILALCPECGQIWTEEMIE